MMVGTRVILRADLERAAAINDAVALEFDKNEVAVDVIGAQLGVDIPGAALVGAINAKRVYPDANFVTIKRAKEATTHAFTLGVVAALRAVEVVGRE